MTQTELFTKIRLNGKSQTWEELALNYGCTGNALKKRYRNWVNKNQQLLDTYNIKPIVNYEVKAISNMDKEVYDYVMKETLQEKLFKDKWKIHNPFDIYDDKKTVVSNSLENLVKKGMLEEANKKYSFNKNNILLIGDIHEPFGHKDYLQHCLNVQNTYNCGTVIFIGDINDLHGLSFHEHNPNLYSPGHEIELAKKRLSKWYEAFPEAIVTSGNHDLLIKRKMRHAGIPDNLCKPMNEIFGTPNWTYVDKYIQDNILFTHGTGLSATTINQKALYENMSVVCGHLHTNCKVEWLTQKIFTMFVGCGIDHEHEAFDYARNVPKKPILSCGVIINGLPLNVPMK